MQLEIIQLLVGLKFKIILLLRFFLGGGKKREICHRI